MKDSIVHLVGQLQACALQTEQEVYLVGGIVRDYLLGATLKDTDIDLLVDGDTTAYSKELQRLLGGELLCYDKFLTKKLHSIDGCSVTELDIIRTRRETYSQPGALPTVEPGSIHQDLLRRDFTVNALACPLKYFDSLLAGTITSDQILDNTGGFSDLQNRLLRVLHNDSFRDDPTRLFRMLRYKYRLSFEIESKTDQLASDAIADNCLQTVSKQRIATELNKILKEQCASSIWSELRDRKLLSLEPFTALDSPKIEQGLATLFSSSDNVSQFASSLLLGLMCSDSKPEEIWSSLGYTRKQKKALGQVVSTWKEKGTTSLSDEARKVIEIYQNL